MPKVFILIIIFLLLFLDVDFTLPRIENNNIWLYNWKFYNLIYKSNLNK